MNTRNLKRAAEPPSEIKNREWTRMDANNWETCRSPNS